jgi:hypothetical protein
VVQTTGYHVNKAAKPRRGVLDESHYVIDTPEPALSHRFWNEELEFVHFGQRSPEMGRGSGLGRGLGVGVGLGGVGVGQGRGK